MLPGLIDLHTHLVDAGQDADLALPLKTSPQATALIGAHNACVTLLAGFTTVRDVGTYRGLTDVALRNAINEGAGARPAHVRGRRLYHHPRRRRRAQRRSCRTISFRPTCGSACPQRRRKRTPKAEFLFDHGVDFLKMIATGAVLAIGHRAGPAGADRGRDARRGRRRQGARQPTPPPTPTAPKGIKVRDPRRRAHRSSTPA